MESQLDALLNNLNKLNNLNLSEVLIEEEILENNVNEDIDTTINSPKLVISQPDLIRAINLSSTIIQPKSDNIVYNSLTFISKNSLKIFATNELSHFVYDVPIIENTLDLVFSIPLSLIQKLTKLIGKKVMFYINENKLYIRLLSGDLLLDLRIPNMNLIKLPIRDEDIQDSFEIPINTLGRITSSILPILNTELRSDFKKISFLGTKAYYLSPFYYIEANIVTPNMSLRMKDAEFISKLYKFYSDKNIRLNPVKSKVNRIHLKMENITYIFVSGQAEIEESTKSQVDKLIKPINIIINFDRFNKIINLATLLPNSTGDIRLNINDSTLIINLISSSGESTFNISFELINKEGINKSILLHAETLKKLLASFTDTSKIGLSLTDYGVILEKEGVKAILMKVE